MTTTSMRARIERKGYSIVANFNGSYTAKKNNTTINATSITALHRELFGY